MGQSSWKSIDKLYTKNWERPELFYKWLEPTKANKFSQRSDMYVPHLLRTGRFAGAAVCSGMERPGFRDLLDHSCTFKNTKTGQCWVTAHPYIPNTFLNGFKDLKSAREYLNVWNKFIGSAFTVELGEPPSWYSDETYLLIITLRRS